MSLKRCLRPALILTLAVLVLAPAGFGQTRRHDLSLSYGVLSSLKPAAALVSRINRSDEVPLLADTPRKSVPPPAVETSPRPNVESISEQVHLLARRGSPQPIPGSLTWPKTASRLRAASSPVWLMCRLGSASQCRR